MKTNTIRRLLMLAALLVLTCLVFTACGDRTREEAPADENVAVAEQTEESEAVEEPAVDATAEEDAKAAEEAAAKEQEKKAAEEKAAAEKAAKEKEKADKEKSSKDKEKAKKKSSKSSNSSSSTATQPKEKQKVWVEPITETRTVTLDTGTRYCNGANSNGGCGASWHGSKESTYNSWHSHWQDYVKKRTVEEAEKGNVYVCDHIHDDSRWVPDTTTETVVVQEGYWKEIDG